MVNLPLASRSWGTNLARPVVEQRSLAARADELESEAEQLVASKPNAINAANNELRTDTVLPFVLLIKLSGEFIPH